MLREIVGGLRFVAMRAAQWLSRVAVTLSENADDVGTALSGRDSFSEIRKQRAASRRAAKGEV